VPLPFEDLSLGLLRKNSHYKLRPPTSGRGEIMSALTSASHSTGS